MFRGRGSIQAYPGSRDCHQPQNRSWTWISSNFPGASLETQSRCKTLLAFDTWQTKAKVSPSMLTNGATQNVFQDGRHPEEQRDRLITVALKWWKCVKTQVVCTMIHKNQRYFASLLVNVYINGVFADFCSQTKYIWLYCTCIVLKILNTSATTLQSALTKLT